ncbi:class I SAM-dependent methyltransferase [Sessilibacter sp. MAH4]
MAHKSEAWTKYWSTGALTSCSPKDINGVEIFRSYWHDYALGLCSGTTIIDLGTGSGYVASIINTANRGLNVIGVDASSADYAQVKNENKNLSDVSLLNNTDFTTFDFWRSHSSFDTIVSLFGVEYSNLNLLLESLSEFITKDNAFNFVIHYDKGPIVAAGKENISAINFLLQKDSFIQKFNEYSQKRLSLRELQEYSQDLVSSSKGSRLNNIVKNVLLGADLVLKNRANDFLSYQVWLEQTEIKLKAELERNKQLIGAGKSSNDMDDIFQLFSNYFVCNEPKLLRMDAGAGMVPIAWSFTGENN